MRLVNMIASAAFALNIMTISSSYAQESRIIIDVNNYELVETIMNIHRFLEGHYEILTNPSGECFIGIVHAGNRNYFIEQSTLKKSNLNGDNTVTLGEAITYFETLTHEALSPNCEEAIKRKYGPKVSPNELLV